MEQEISIPIWNSKGNILGYKTNEDVNPRIDILNTSIVLLFNRTSQLLISKLKDSIWENKWGASTSTIVRRDESSTEAARRVLLEDFCVYKSNLILVKERYYELEGIKRFLSIFFMVTDDKPRINKDKVKEFKFINSVEIKNMRNNSEFDPSFIAAFDNIKDLIL